MNVRMRILTGFIAVILISVIIGAAGFVTSAMLSRVSTELNILQIESASIANVLNAHYIWRQGLTEAVLNGTEFTGSLDPTTCALGQWHRSEEARNMSDPELLRLLASLDEPHRLIHEEAASVVSRLEAGGREQARTYLNEQILPKTQEVISILTTMQERYTALTTAKSEETSSIETLVAIINGALIFIAIAVGIFFALIISNSISKPLAPLTGFMRKAGTEGDIVLRPEDMKSISGYSKRKDEIGQTISAAAAFVTRVIEISNALGIVADGDLTVEIEPLSERDVLGISLQKMTQNLNTMFTEINTATTQVSTGSHQIADGAQTLAAGSTEQAASVQELSSSIAEVAERTKDNSAKADQAADLANTIKGSAEKGSGQMDDMMKSVRDINASSQSISKVIKTIDDIAFQTNILALNAAVEAARAGQHGKGFAVVAEEVRNLSAKSAQAAKDTETLIEDSMQKAAQGVKIAGETSASLSEIVKGINESTALITEIARASEEQSKNISQINSGVEQVAKVVQQNSATAQESAAASEEMSSQSAILRELIAQFKLKNVNEQRRIEAAGGELAPKRLPAGGNAGAGGEIN